MNKNILFLLVGGLLLAGAGCETGDRQINIEDLTKIGNELVSSTNSGKDGLEVENEDEDVVTSTEDNSKELELETSKIKVQPTTKKPVTKKPVIEVQDSMEANPDGINWASDTSEVPVQDGMAANPDAINWGDDNGAATDIKY